MKEGIRIRVDEEVIKLKGSIKGIITSISPLKDGWEVTILDSDDDDFDDSETELEKELEALYADRKEIIAIGQDPEQGYDRSFEAELSRLEDNIDLLEDLIDQRKTR